MGMSTAAAYEATLPVPVDSAPERPHTVTSSGARAVPLRAVSKRFIAAAVGFAALGAVATILASRAWHEPQQQDSPVLAGSGQLSASLSALQPRLAPQASSTVEGSLSPAASGNAPVVEPNGAPLPATARPAASDRTPQKNVLPEKREKTSVGPTPARGPTPDAGSPASELGLSTTIEKLIEIRH